ncbi:MAG: CPBP family intramembrane metalloprotease [Chloroflexi bacterium]|nr:CPBP family intramembrane metalloprotease [Chloroflexota bacterium]
MIALPGGNEFAIICDCYRNINLGHELTMLDREIWRVPWNVKDVLWGLLLVAAAALLVVAIYRFLLSEASLLPTPLILLQGSMLLAAFAFGTNRYHSGWQSLGLRALHGHGSFSLAWLVLLGSLGFTSLYVFFVNWSGWNRLLPQALSGQAIGEGWVRLLNIFFLGLFGPFSEEVFFRGFVMPSLVPRVGVLGAIGITSLLFALGHMLIGLLVPVFVSGCLLAWLYLKTRSIWPSVAAHSAQNLLALSLLT